MADPTFHPSIPHDGFWLPHAASTIAPEIDAGWDLSYWLSVIFFFLIVIPAVVFVVKYRRTSDKHVGAPTGHNTALEIVWSVIPLAIVMACFLVGFRGYLHASVPPSDAYDINVTGQKWLWTFLYPNGVTSPGELRVPLGRPTRLVMSSKDVIHSLYIPAFRVKQDVVPGSYSSLWFEPTEAGEFTIECAEYCGGVGESGHSTMLARVVVMQPDDFNKWLDSEAKAGAGADPVELGKKLFTKMTCNTCHSLTETLIPGGGPSFKGVWGRHETMSDGSSVTVDENYVRESILFPQAKIVKGFGPIMPSFKGQLKDYEIDGLIAYLKTLK
jgi:cytochrome c oxidase subunit 2